MDQSPNLRAVQARRRPAHLSVSLRHDSPMTESTDTSLPLPLPYRNSRLGSSGSLVPESDIVDKGRKWTTSGIKGWFDSSNTNSTFCLDQAFNDSASPPHFLHNNSSGTSSDMQPTEEKPQVYRVPPIAPSETNGSRTDDFRSVIDDLTIENRRLKEELRRYKAWSRLQLDKEKLFEVKIHGLPSDKRRELEQTLSAFATSIKGVRGLELREQTRDAKHGNLSKTSHNTSSLTNSASSRPVDSGYASMSTSGPTNAPNSEHKTSSRNSGENSVDPAGKKVEAVPEDIPKGLLPKYAKYTTLTERQKKKIVVKRLEELFAGKIETKVGNSQPMQQQEVSNSAAKADRASGANLSFIEGIREAHMLMQPMDVEAASNGEQVDDTGSNSAPRSGVDSSDSGEHSPEQRPTRPLDLDPDRAQIPSDNVDYIRHLGLSTPRLSVVDTNDAAADADGWIYLNLLMSMAQLHMINVTADFVRSAVSDVSEKFQLSRDGKKIRWRGGTERTRLTSDSENGSSAARSPLDGDDLGQSGNKRRKIDGQHSSTSPSKSRDDYISAFHYKPIFIRRGSSGNGTQSNESDSYPSEYNTGNVMDMGKSSNMQSHSSSNSRRRRHSGTIVYYSGAEFFTDLSGDRGSMNNVSGSKKPPESTVEEILGVEKRKRVPISRATSGSSIATKQFFALQGSSKETLSTPMDLSDDTLTIDFVSAPFPPSESQSPEHIFLDLPVSGLGGTHPADHFAVKVRTRRTVLPGRGRPSRRRRIRHAIPTSLLGTFNAELPDETDSDPVQAEIVSAQYRRLNPSPLPAPSNYYSMASTSSTSSGSTSTSSGSTSSPSGSSASRSGSKTRNSLRYKRPVFKSTVPDEDSGELDDDELDDEEECSDSSEDILAKERVSKLRRDVLAMMMGEESKEDEMSVDEVSIEVSPGSQVG